MRTGLVVIGIILLVLGAVFYYWPTMTATASGAEAGQPPVTVYGAATLPGQLSIAAMLGGILLIVLGLIVPYRTGYAREEHARHAHEPERDVVYEKTVERRRVH